MPDKSFCPKATEHETNSKPQMPYIDLDSVNCNCSRWPKPGLILTTEDHQNNASQFVTPDPVEHNSTVETDNSAMSLEVFKLKGCSYHPPMQKALRFVQGKIAAKEELDVKILEQPLNVEDENALIVKVKINEIYEPVGYVQRNKIPKI